jgi:hypothetical protein
MSRNTGCEMRIEVLWFRTQSKMKNLFIEGGFDI